VLQKTVQGIFTYKRIVAAAFLLLYLFIAAPVSLWHQHTAVKQEQNAAAKITAPKAAVQNEDCKICQHTYTAYINDAVACNVAAVFLFAPVYSDASSVISSFAPGNTSNKSPPVFV